MMKNPLAYFHIATFLLSGKSRNLSEYWKAEVIMQESSFMVMLISVRMSLYGRIQPLVKRFLTVGKTILLLAIMSILVPIHVLLG